MGKADGRVMIIKLLGTNGAGKSTLVRTIMRDYQVAGDVITVQYPSEEGRKLRPQGYICRANFRRLFVLGHYEIANGGVDTLPSLDYAYKLALTHHELGSDVMMEGKNFNDSAARTLILIKNKLDVRVVLLDLGVDLCIQSVRERGHNISEDTIRKLHKKSRDQYSIFQNAGATTFKGGRSQCLAEVRKWLRKV
jgi:energy-coupling factor transporter ATP-binding protein EcfA2